MKKPKVILIIAISLDGRIALPFGGPSPIGSYKDKNLLDKSLVDIDATLFGSGTLKAHQSTYLRKERNFLKNKKQISNSQPISIITGNSEKFSNKWKFFNQPLKKWLISSSKIIKNSNLNFDKTFIFENSWAETLNILKKEGIHKMALLGGAKLIYSFIKEDLIDEIKITICPKIIGGNLTWIPSNNSNEIYKLTNNWDIKQIKKLSTNEIFVHYKKNAYKIL